MDEDQNPEESNSTDDTRSKEPKPKSGKVLKPVLDISGGGPSDAPACSC